VPKGKVRRKNINFNQWASWNFDHDWRGRGGNINSHWGFANNWNIGGGVDVNGETFDDRRTRGGPGALRPGGVSSSVYVESDNRRLVTMNVSADGSRNRHGSYGWGQSTGITLRSSAALLTSVSMDIRQNVDDSQWVTNEDAEGRTRYVFGHLAQRTVSLTAAGQLHAAPDDHASGVRSSLHLRGRVHRLQRAHQRACPTYDDRYAPYAFSGNPDFLVRSFRMTNVLRWEYRPGSTFFAVWQQGRGDSANRGDLRFSRDIRGVFDAPGDNTFVIKISRWFDF
jgi:hypothetical protein